MTSSIPGSCLQLPCGPAQVQLQPKPIQCLKLSYWLCGPSAGMSYLISRGGKKIPSFSQTAGPGFRNHCAQAASALVAFPRRVVLKHRFPICCSNSSSLHCLFTRTFTFGDHLANFSNPAFTLKCLGYVRTKVTPDWQQEPSPEPGDPGLPLLRVTFS